MKKTFVFLFSILVTILFSIEVYSQVGSTPNPTPPMTQSPTPGMTQSPTPGMTQPPTPPMQQSPTPGMTQPPTPPTQQSPPSGTTQPPTSITPDCAGGTLPCGNACYNPRLGQSCVNGVITQSMPNK